MSPRDQVYINFFRPVGGSLGRETRVIRIVLLLWALLSFGIPALIFLVGLDDPSGSGASVLTRTRLLGFPLHYWLLAQGCTIGYVLLCKLYCELWNRRNSDPSR